jgi:hypothetical protein
MKVANQPAERSTGINDARVEEKGWPRSEMERPKKN